MGKLSPLKLIVILNGVKNLEILRLWLRMTFPKRSRLTDYLSIPEKIQFVKDVRDNIASILEAVELTEKEKEELEKRLKA